MSQAMRYVLCVMISSNFPLSKFAQYTPIFKLSHLDKDLPRLIWPDTTIYDMRGPEFIPESLFSVVILT